ncbi:MAG: hypothetical protein E7325_09400 [Clostridiales bacterium]|nr:hypothetical protein [Clostridiales bacterium]
MDYSPPRIYHGARKPTTLKEVIETVEAAGKNAKLTHSEKALLLFYARQKQGFTPAEKLTLKETGISERRLHNVRDSLQRMNIIDYGNTGEKHFLFVNWTVIWGLESLDKPLKVGGKDRKYFVPMDQKCFCGHPYFTNDERLKYVIGYIRDNPPKTWTEYGNTTESWEIWRRYFRAIGKFTEGEYLQLAEVLMQAEGVERKLPMQREIREHIKYSSPERIIPKKETALQVYTNGVSDVLEEDTGEYPLPF